MGKETCWVGIRGQSTKAEDQHVPRLQVGRTWLDPEPGSAKKEVGDEACGRESPLGPVRILVFSLSRVGNCCKVEA